MCKTKRKMKIPQVVRFSMAGKPSVRLPANATDEEVVSAMDGLMKMMKIRGGKRSKTKTRK